MSLQFLTYLVVGASFALYIGIAVWARAGSTSDFYVAGSGVHPVINGMATAADWMSAASFISLAGLVAYMGYGGSLFLMGWTGGYVLMATLMAPYLRKFGRFTVPAFFADRYYSKTAAAMAVFCLLICSLTYIIGQMTGVGVTFSRFLGVSNEMGIYIGMAIVFSYAVFGGMKGITYTQVAQYCVLIVAYTIPAIFISFQLTGVPIPQLGLGASLVGEDITLLTKLNQVIMELGFGEYTTALPGSKLNMFVYTVSLMIGTAGLPHVIIRFFTVPTVADARYSAGWSLVFIAILYTTVPAVAAMARFNLHATVSPEINTGAPLVTEGAGLVYEDRPEWMKRWEATGLLTWTDKNNDGLIQHYNDKNKSPEFQAKVNAAGWQGDELAINRDIIVMANPEIALLPNWVIALVAAGGIASALSTAASLLLAVSSAISHDLLKKNLMPDMDEKKELLIGKISMAFAIVLAGYLGLNPPGFAAGTVALAFGIAGSSIFPALIMGIFNKNMCKYGAISGMIAGLFVTLFYVFAHKGIFFFKGTEYLGLIGGANSFFGIAPEAFGVVGACVNFLVAYIVSKLTPPPPEHIQHMVEGVRTPRGSSVVTGTH